MTRQKIKRILNKKIFHLSAMMIFTLGILASTLSLAYFTSADKTSNTVTATDIRIDLVEPDWYSTGAKDASKLEPGMVIKKNPYVINRSVNPVYVRMQVVLKDETGTEISSESDQYKALLTSIYINGKDGEADTPLFTIDEDGNITATADGYVYKDGWFYYATTEKVTAEVEGGEEAGEVEAGGENAGEAVEGEDVGEATENGEEVTTPVTTTKTVFTELPRNESTPELFNYLKTPIKKSEYQYFSENFTVEIIAQGINAGENEKKMTEEQLIKRFEECYSDEPLDDEEEEVEAPNDEGEKAEVDEIENG
jgi:hypothetical protein